MTVGAPPTGQSPDRTCVGVAVWRAEMAVSSHCKGDAFPLATLSLARLQVDPIGHRPDWLQRGLESGESDTLSHGMEAADQTPPSCLSSSSRCKAPITPNKFSKTPYPILENRKTGCGRGRMCNFGQIMSIIRS